MSDGLQVGPGAYHITDVVPIKDKWRNAIPVYESAGIDGEGIDRSRPIDKDSWTED